MTAFDSVCTTLREQPRTWLVTGCAGFIGSNLVKKHYKEIPEAKLIGIDNMNDY